MIRHLDDMALTILYHALGSDLTEGIKLFEVSFFEAESNYHLNDIDSLLDLLADPTLHDPRRLAWRHYFNIRKELLQWHLSKADKLLDAQIDIETKDIPALQPRLNLLRGQAKVMHGDWIAGLNILERVASAEQSAKEMSFEADLYEWIARAYMGRVVSSGGWNEIKNHGAGALFQRALNIIMMPFYAFIWIYLRRINAYEFWQSLRCYGMDSTNWPIFWYYLRASRALFRAKQITPSADSDRIFRLEIMQADLMRQLLAGGEAVAIYQKWLDRLPQKGAEYSVALLKHGQAQTLLDQGENPKAQMLLEQARQVYSELENKRASAYVDLLLGDIAFQSKSIEHALNQWDSALTILKEHQDTIGLAEGLSRCYAILEGAYTDQVKQRASKLVHSVGRQVFTVRVTNRLLNLLQLMAWITPILVAFALAVMLTNYVFQASLQEAWARARLILLGQGLLVAITVIFATGITNVLLGLIGLAYTLRTNAIRLDFIALDETALYYYDFNGNQQACFPWSEIQTYLRIEREIGLRPSPSLSYDYICTTTSQTIRLPAVTTWFSQLQQEAEHRIGRAPQSYRLHWFGIQFIAVNVLMDATVATAFIFTQVAILGISVSTRAWLASLLMAGAHIGLFYITAGWLLHYIRVHYHVTPVSRFALIVGGLSAIMIGLGIFAKSLVFLWAPSLIFWGTILLYGLVHRIGYHRSNKQQRLMTIFQGGVLVIGTLLVLRALLPMLINWQALTYLGAAGKFDPDNPTILSQEVRTSYFEKMGRLGQWMIRIDPTYPFGYGYVGYERYFEGDYETSIAAYNQAIYFTGFRAPRDYYYCRALAYYKLGDTYYMQQDSQVFENIESSGKTMCEILFPEEAPGTELP